jgi:hypothetical protein
VGYLVNTVDPVPLVLDLHIVHDLFGSRSDPILNGQLHYPPDLKNFQSPLSKNVMVYLNEDWCHWSGEVSGGRVILPGWRKKK